MDQPGKRLSILLVVNSTGKKKKSLSPFAPENLISWNGFGHPVPRQACSFSTPRLKLVLTRGVSSDFRGGPFIYYLSRHTRKLGVVDVLVGGVK